MFNETTYLEIGLQSYRAVCDDTIELCFACKPCEQEDDTDTIVCMAFQFCTPNYRLLGVKVNGKRVPLRKTKTVQSKFDANKLVRENVIPDRIYKYTRELCQAVEDIVTMDNAETFEKLTSLQHREIVVNKGRQIIEIIPN